MLKREIVPHWQIEWRRVRAVVRGWLAVAGLAAELNGSRGDMFPPKCCILV